VAFAWLANDPQCIKAAAPELISPIFSGTTSMAEKLQLITRHANPEKHPYLNDQLVAVLQTRIPAITQGREGFQLRADLARQLLQAGRSVEALHAWDELDRFALQQRLRLSSHERRQYKFLRALTWLRLGEQENCLINHTTESCLLPIQGNGVHRRPAGARKAVELFTELLRGKPGDLSTRWLLNIAHMTLGEYPHAVPSEWLIPPAAFASEYDIGKFHDVAGGLGIDVDELAGGVVIEDFDGDGDLDLMVSTWRLGAQLRYFNNDGRGRFVERTREAGLTGITGGLNLMQTDYDNDGRPDVFILRGAWLGAEGRHPNSLLRNRGEGVFEDVTEAAGLLSFFPTQTATWFDFDHDGWLDVFIGNESLGPDQFPCELYRNNRDGTFTEIATASGVAVVDFVKGVTSGDYNGDGWPDLFLASRLGTNRLLRNDGVAKNGGWSFTDVTAQAGILPTEASFPAWFFDYDNDGHLDIFVAGYSIREVGEIAADYLGLPHNAERARLYRNQGDGAFADVTKESGLYRVIHGMGCNFGDLDNDGWLDFYVGTGDPDLATLIPNRMFRNNAGQGFQEVTTSGGFGHLQKGHAIAFADLDHDGDQDVYADMGGAYSGDTYRNSLFLNPGHGNHWLTLKLEGKRSNRAAIGARIKVAVDTGAGLRVLYKTVNSGGSFGANPLRQQIGLAQAKAIHHVEVFWPTTGVTQRFQGLELDRGYLIREDQATVAALPLLPIKLDLTRDPYCDPATLALKSALTNALAWPR